jgi:hypothetical protein
VGQLWVGLRWGAMAWGGVGGAGGGDVVAHLNDEPEAAKALLAVEIAPGGGFVCPGIAPAIGAPQEGSSAAGGAEAHQSSRRASYAGHAV